MSLTAILVTLAEVAFGGLIIWGFWNEEKVVALEDRILAKMGFKIRKKHSAKITRFDPNCRSSKHCI